MKAFTITFLSFAAAMSVSAASADEMEATEVVVVTAKRAAPPEQKQNISAEIAAPEIDFTRLAIQAPTLNYPATPAGPGRIELAEGGRAGSKS